MTGFAVPQFTPLGATGLLVRFGDRIDRSLSLKIARLVDSLDRAQLAGLVDLVPGYTTLTVLFDAATTDGDTIAGHIASLWQELPDNPVSDNGNARVVEIPVVYGGEAGPDLDEVARAADLSPEEVIRRHSEADYSVGALGFAPGFAFLIGLPHALETPRRARPRVRVPAGSVGIAGAQTGVYPLPTPGGWSLIGRTPRVMFDPLHPSDDELRPGDRVRFVPVAADDAPPFPDPAAQLATVSEQAGPLEIAEAGVQTSVQDLGRPGRGRIGISPGGALDRSALIAGNRLLGNADDTAALEWTLVPPVIRFHEDCRMVLTGADPGWTLNGRRIAIGDVVTVRTGDELRARAVQEPRGTRGYLCVAGGVDVPVVRGSRALDLSAGFGGGFGRPLRRGDRLPVGEYVDSPDADNVITHEEAADPALAPFRVVRGPQADRFDDAAWATLLHESFTVDAQSNRMGLRLNGPAVMPAGGADVISEGTATGAIQVTGSGQPIVLLPGRATIGGYTKIATVIEADHDRLGQVRPGMAIRFTEVSVADAREALARLRPSVPGGLNGEASGEAAMTEDASRTPTLDDAWTPDGVIRVIRALATHEVQAFSLRVASAGLEIAIDRGGVPGRPGQVYRDQGEPNPAEPSEPEQADNQQADENGVIRAPLLGTFYRRSSPNDPVLAGEGDAVAAGQPVGVIEVMKSYHEVTAPVAGVVTRVLVEDGSPVEFGQVLMEIDPVAGDDE